MPAGDRTGPMGFGPMTGRAAGICAGFGMPGYVNPAPGRGMGWGRGGGRGRGGRGWRHMFYATGLPGWMRFGPFAPAAVAAPEGEKQFLEAQAKAIQDQLEDIKNRLAEIETEQAG